MHREADSDNCETPIAAVVPIGKTDTRAGKTGEKGPTRVSINDILTALHDGGLDIEVVEVPARPTAEQAMTMNSRRAANLASAAMLGAGQEVSKGHHKCAKLKMNASAMWLAIAEFHERAEELVKVEARRAEAEHLNDLVHVVSEERGIPADQAYDIVSKQLRDERLGRTKEDTAETPSSGNEE